MQLLDAKGGHQGPTPTETACPTHAFTAWLTSGSRWPTDTQAVRQGEVARSDARYPDSRHASSRPASGSVSQPPQRMLRPSRHAIMKPYAVKGAGKAGAFTSRTSSKLSLEGLTPAAALDARIRCLLYTSRFMQ